MSHGHIQPPASVLRRAARTLRCLASDCLALLETTLAGFAARAELVDRARRARRSDAYRDAYRQAAKGLCQDPSLPIPEDRRFDALLAFERLVDQGIDVATAYAVVLDEEW